VLNHKFSKNVYVENIRSVGQFHMSTQANLTLSTYTIC